MKSLTRKGEIGDSFLQGVRLDLVTSGIGVDANATRLSPAARLRCTYIGKRSVIYYVNIKH